MKKTGTIIGKIRSWFGNDGMLHAIICFAIVMTAAHFVNIGLALFAAIFTGFAKEIIWDAWMRKGTFQWKDIWCDLIGAVPAFAMLLLKTLAL